MADLPSWARKGALVICVDAAPPAGGWASLGRLEKRGIYEIDGISDPDAFGRLGLLLKGISRARYKSLPGIRGYRLSRFRPLVENASDSEVEATLYNRRRQTANA